MFFFFCQVFALDIVSYMFHLIFGRVRSGMGGRACTTTMAWFYSDKKNDCVIKAGLKCGRFTVRSRG